MSLYSGQEPGEIKDQPSSPYPVGNPCMLSQAVTPFCVSWTCDSRVCARPSPSTLSVSTASQLAGWHAAQRMGRPILFFLSGSEWGGGRGSSLPLTQSGLKDFTVCMCTQHSKKKIRVTMLLNCFSLLSYICFLLTVNTSIWPDEDSSWNV